MSNAYNLNVDAIKRQKNEEYQIALREYNNQISQVPIIELKKWASSWIVLALSILVSVTAVFNLISLFSNLNSGWLNIIINVVNLIISIIVCVGFWCSYAMGKSKDKTVKLNGPKLLRGVLTYNKVMMFLTMIGIIALIILIFAMFKSCVGETDSNTANSGDSPFNTITTGIWIVIILAVVIVFVIQIIYYTSVTNFANNAINCLIHKCVGLTSCSTAVFFFFIIGILNLVYAILTLVLASSINGIFDSILKSINISNGDTQLININVVSMLPKFVESATYIFAGILAHKFSTIDEAIKISKMNIEKPEEPIL